MEKKIDDFFDGRRNAGVLREICCLAGWFTGENLLENAGRRKAAIMA